MSLAGIAKVPPIQSAREPRLADGAATDRGPHLDTVLLPGAIGDEDVHRGTIGFEDERSRAAAETCIVLLADEIAIR